MNDIYTSVTDRIVAALEAGVAPWVRPWSGEIDPVPVNAQTRRPYRGINNVLLQLEASAHGYARNAWMTYRQANELGGHVRKGEHGVQVIFWNLRRIKAVGDAFPASDESDIEERVIPLVRAYTVFNVVQIDGLPADYTLAMPSVPTWTAHEAAERIVEGSHAVVRQGGSKAFYSPSEDIVQMPTPAAFADASAWYGTLLHELAHWTGAPHRLNRELSRRFGDEAYAAEELIAELASAFLCAACRIDGRLQHAEYIGSWLRVLKNDKRAIVVASAKAQHAADYLLDRRVSDADELEAA